MKAISLGNLEKQIMDILWDGKVCSVRDAMERLGKKKLAYTTVATILKRIYDKGLLNRRESKAGYIYFPRFSKESYGKNIAKTFLKKFMNSFGDTAIVSFAEGIDKLPDKKRKHFLKLLNEYDRGNKR